MENPHNLPEKARSRKKAWKGLTQKLRKRPKGEVDGLFHELHEEAFAHVDCLSCANCCKTTSPRFLWPDIERLSRLFKMKTKTFIDLYLTQDDEGDFVLQSAPCPFLLADNKCLVYDQRPAACRGFPHTDGRQMRKKLSLSLKNTEICPAVFRIFEQLAQRI